MTSAETTLPRPLFPRRYVAMNAPATMPAIEPNSQLLSPLAPGTAILSFCRAGERTVLGTARAASPVRLLQPNNHGAAAWVFLANLGGGLVDGDRLETRVHVEAEAMALLGTQASTKVYRSPRGCSQTMQARVDDGGTLVVVADPVVCFAGARYAQRIDVDLAPRGSLLLCDAYTCGRGARGERWAFDQYESRTEIRRDGARLFVDATRLHPGQGPIAARMGRFEAIVSLLAVGPALASVRDEILASCSSVPPSRTTLVCASPVRSDGAWVRVAAERYHVASHPLRRSFDALARLLGDDPFSRKW